MHYIVMGVSGCGKSSVGAAVATALGAIYRDADDLHTSENIAKMARGVALIDADRWLWLDRVGTVMTAYDGVVVMGCSALKRRYRDRIRAAVSDVVFVHLAGEYDVINARMQTRAAHYMPTSLLDSQFAALEPLDTDEAGVTVAIDQSLSQVVAQVLALI